MSVRRDSNGQWRYRKVIKLYDGSKVRISGTPTRNTREEAEKAERAHILRVLNPPPPPKKVVPTFTEWFTGRYWTEWVVGRRNKPSTVEHKLSTYKIHLEPFFGHMRLDEIKVGEIAQFRAKLVKRGMTDKTINNVLGTLSKPLRYAYDVELIDRAPKVGLFKVEQPEIEFWDFSEYARVLAAGKRHSEVAYAADRHTFGTHSAMLGVNPWRLMSWMGHKRVEETLRYVHVAEAHGRETPEAMLQAAEGIFDPDKRILVMLGARAQVGHHVGTTQVLEDTAPEVGHQVGTSGGPGSPARRLQAV